MKRSICLLLVCAVLAGLTGCSSENGDILDPVTFYYVRNMDDPEALVYKPEKGVIAAEIREGAGHTDDLDYLLTLYLQGPLDNTLQSPFPSGCKLIRVLREGDTLHLKLDETITQLQNMDLTLACACLARTCLSLTNAEQVHIEAASAGNNSVDVVIGADSLLLVDESTLPEETTAQE